MDRIIYSLDLKSINDLCDNTLICNSIFCELNEKGTSTVEISEETKTYHVYGYSSDTVVNLADLLISKMGEIKIDGYYKAIGGEQRTSHAGKTSSYARRFFFYQLPDQKHKIDFQYRYIYLLRYSTNPKAYLRQVDFAVKAENIIPGLYITTITRNDANPDLRFYKIFYVPMEGCDEKVLDSTLNFLKNKEGGENDIKLLEALEKRTNEVLYES